MDCSKDIAYILSFIRHEKAILGVTELVNELHDTLLETMAEHRLVPREHLRDWAKFHNGLEAEKDFLWEQGFSHSKLKMTFSDESLQFIEGNWETLVCHYGLLVALECLGVPPSLYHRVILFRNGGLSDRPERISAGRLDALASELQGDEANLAGDLVSVVKALRKRGQTGSAMVSA